MILIELPHRHRVGAVHLLALLALPASFVLGVPGVVSAQEVERIEGGVVELDPADLPFSSVIKGFASQAAFLLVNGEDDWYRDLVGRAGLDPESGTVRRFLLSFHRLEQAPVPESIGATMEDRTRYKLEWMGREVGGFLRALENEGWSRGDLDSLLEAIDRVQRPQISRRAEYVGARPDWGAQSMAWEEDAFSEELRRWIDVTVP